MAGAIGFDLPDGIEGHRGPRGVRAGGGHHPIRQARRAARRRAAPLRAGRAYTPEVRQLIREIRQASAEAGYFNLAVPESLGGGGWATSRTTPAWSTSTGSAAAHRWLAQFTISHWAFGPSAVLERVTERARAEILPGLMSGEEMMCFGMSEPDAGSDATMLRTRGRAATATAGASPAARSGRPTCRPPSG